MKNTIPPNKEKLNLTIFLYMKHVRFFFTKNIILLFLSSLICCIQQYNMQLKKKILT